MKRLKKISVLLIAMLIMSALSTTAFAKAKYNVPTSGDYYQLNSRGRWVKTGSFAATYKSDGRILTFTHVSDNKIDYTYQYKWSKTLLKKMTMIDYGSSSTSITTTSFKYKGGLPKKVKKAHQYFSSTNALYNDAYTTTSKYSWNGKTATVKSVDSDDGARSDRIVTSTKNKQYKGKYTDYNKVSYKKGKIKKITVSQKGSESSVKETTNFNKYGYVSSYTRNSSTNRPTGISSSNSSGVYTYIWGPGHCPTEIHYTYSSSYYSFDPIDNDADSSNSSGQYKIVITGSKAVKNIYNCDRFGHPVWLGYNPIDDLD